MSSGAQFDLPKVAFGCGNFGGLGSALQYHGQGLTEAQAFKLMDASWELGITHFDTADAYGGGRSEQMVGAWIRSRGVRPTLTTKTFNPMTVDADRGLAGERILRALPASLERLGIDHVDLYLAHDFDPNVPLAETMGAFDELVSKGYAKAYGVSNFNAAQLAAAVETGSPAAIQNAYSLLVRDDEAAIRPLCVRACVAYLAYSPLAGGWLTGKYRAGQSYEAGSRMALIPKPYERLLNDQTNSAIDRLRLIAEERGVSLAALAMAWVIADPEVAQIVTGPVKLDHMGPVREALENPLTPEERSEITRRVFE